MKCPFLQFERECVGVECPLFVQTNGHEQTASPPPRPTATCGLRVLVGMCSAYSRDRHRMVEEMESLGKRISRKIDDLETGARHRW
jgi:hypothetical protein